MVNSTLVANATGSGGDGGIGGTAGAIEDADGTGGAAGNGGFGGALYVQGATATLTHVTVSSNSLAAAGEPGLNGSGTTRDGTSGQPASGGGVYTSGAPAAGLRNTLLASNALGNCAGTAPTDLNDNLSYGDSSCPPEFATGDPDLGPLQDNGGPTATVAIGAGGAAVDQVPVADCLAVDQRGVTRPQGPDCDIGAYELAAPAVTNGIVTGVTATTVTLHASVTPNQASAQIRFEFGPTTAYGSSTPTQSLAGIQSQPISATLANLRPGTTYHFRIVATSADGTTNGPDASFRTGTGTGTVTTPPRLSSLKVKKKRKSATITYKDSAAATTTFVVYRSSAGIKRGKRCVARSKQRSHGHKCTLLSKLGSFKHADRAGANSVALPRRIGGHKLKAGTYVVRATARLRTATSNTASVAWKITG